MTPVLLNVAHVEFFKRKTVDAQNFLHALKVRRSPQRSCSNLRHFSEEGPGVFSGLYMIYMMHENIDLPIFVYTYIYRSAVWHYFSEYRYDIGKCFFVIKESRVS